MIMSYFKDLDFKRVWIAIRKCLFLFMVCAPTTNSTAEFGDILSNENTISQGSRYTVSVNTGALVVLSGIFQRFHVPMNIETAIASNRSIVIGVHAALPMNGGDWREAFGSSFRIRQFFTQVASHRLWIELGIWGIYQENRLGSRERDTYRERLSDSMLAVNSCIGYKCELRDGPWVIQPFMGMAVPIAVFPDRELEFWGYPFPWSGLGIGYVFEK